DDGDGLAGATGRRQLVGAPQVGRPVSGWPRRGERAVIRAGQHLGEAVALAEGDGCRAGRLDGVERGRGGRARGGGAEERDHRECNEDGETRAHTEETPIPRISYAIARDYASVRECSRRPAICQVSTANVMETTARAMCTIRKPAPWLWSFSMFRIRTPHTKNDQTENARSTSRSRRAMAAPYRRPQ